MRKLLILLLIPSIGYSTPAPSGASWSGTLNDGTAITITGTGFGTKSTPAPLVYDKFESGSINSYWTSDNDLAIVTSGPLRSSNSTRHEHLSHIDGTDEGYLSGQNTSYRKWLVSTWMRVETNFDWGTTVFSSTNKFLSNIKIFRLWDPGAEVDNLYVQYDGANNDCFWTTESVSGGGTARFLSTWRTVYTRGDWHQWIFRFYDSDVGSSNGTFNILVDGVQVANNTALKTRDGSSVFKRVQSVGFRNSWGASENGGGGVDPSDDAPNDFYMDDVYVDNTWASVFISDSPTLAGATVREYCAPTAWADTSITCTVTEGTFNGASDTLYAYVMHDDATTNANGFQLDNGATDTTNPTVSITAPIEGATVSGAAVSITANASDDTGVVGVQFKVDGSNQGSEDTTSTYGITWNTTGLSNGTHTITAVARDAAANTATATTVNVTVSNFVSIIPPTKHIKGGRFSGGVRR